MACLVFVAAALPESALCAQDGMTTWACAPVGERRNVLYLIDNGSRSSIKFAGQRVPATVSSSEAGRKWSWGANSVTLAADNFALYYEAGAVKAKFKCKKFS